MDFDAIRIQGEVKRVSDLEDLLQMAANETPRCVEVGEPVPPEFLQSPSLGILLVKGADQEDTILTPLKPAALPFHLPGEARLDRVQRRFPLPPLAADPVNSVHADRLDMGDSKYARNLVGGNC